MGTWGRAGVTARPLPLLRDALGGSEAQRTRLFSFPHRNWGTTKPVFCSEKILAAPKTQEQIERIRRELAGRRCLLSVKRLDYVKRPLEKLYAFERLHGRHDERHPERSIRRVNSRGFWPHPTRSRPSRNSPSMPRNGWHSPAVLWHFFMLPITFSFMDFP